MKYQVIKKGNGKYYPKIVERDWTFGAWNGYRDTYEEALSDIEEKIKEDEAKKLSIEETVVYEVEMDK